MRYWIQFMQPSAVDASKLIDACGDRAVFICDGRNSQYTMRSDALKHAQRHEHYHRWSAFRICQGARLFQESRSTKPEALHYPIHV